MLVYEEIDYCLIALSARLYILDVFDQNTYDKIYTFNSNIKSMKELYSFNSDNEGLIIVNLVNGIL